MGFVIQLFPSWVPLEASRGVSASIALHIRINKNKIIQIKVFGLVRELNPGPLAPEAKIIPLDQRANKYY